LPSISRVPRTQRASGSAKLPLSLANPALFWRCLGLLGLALLSVFSVVAVFAVFTSAAQSAYAQGLEDVTKSFDVLLDVQPNGSMRVTETITQDFAVARHGIQRFIPMTKRLSDTQLRNFRMGNVEVSASSGTPSMLFESENGSIKTIRIGAPDTTVTGKHTYIIEYTVFAVASRFPAGDELYWDGIGTRWEQAIEKPSVTVRFPVAIQRVRCFVGPAGSKTPCANSKISGRTAVFRNGPLGVKEGLTVVVGSANGSLAVNPEISTVDSPKVRSLKHWGPGFFVLLCGWMLARRATQSAGRDRRYVGLALAASVGEVGTESRRSIRRRENREGPVEFGPPELLPPALISLVEKSDRDTQQFSSTLIDLAMRGYMTIGEEGERNDKTWRFTKTTPSPAKVAGSKRGTLFLFETKLLKALFDDRATVTAKELEETFSGPYRSFLTNVEKEANLRKWYRGGEGKVSIVLLGICLIFILPVVAAFLGQGIGFLEPAVGSMALASIVVAFITIARGSKTFKKHRTSVGSAMYSRVLGFKRFLNAGEDRLEHAERTQLFIDFLPYAIAMGIVDQWTKRFADLGELPALDWYQSSEPMDFTRFGRSIETYGRQAASSMSASAPSPSSDYGDDRSSGNSSGFSSSSDSSSDSGGSSGGGGGGGGGGSW
jgi:uncharacterized membrane protein YgcG